jgi:hypothetical protein
MNLSEYADHRGCTRQSVKKAIDENRITATQKNGKWEIDPTVADEEWNRSTNPRYFEQQGALPTNATEYPSINDSRAKHEYYKALLAELAYQSQRQQLVSADEVGREQARIARTTQGADTEYPRSHCTSNGSRVRSICCPCVTNG